MDGKKYSKEEVVKIAKSLIGKSFGEVNNYQTDLDNYTKGTFGHILEEDVYEYNKNSKSEPDFVDAGIELKCTPYKKNKNGSFSAKERLVLNIINYMEDYKDDFYDSHFWYKNKAIQIVWYLYDSLLTKNDYKITHDLLYQFPKTDLPIIIDDYEKIISKIKNGEAHNISESDTMYLGACTKGANANSVRKQPFSDELAKQRAFCFKNSYMTQLVRSHIDNISYERIINDEKLSKVSFTDYISSIVSKYIGKTQDELMELFDLSTTAKNKNELLICRMFNIKSNLSNTEEFVKANIVAKTVRVEYSGTVKESLPFPAFKYIDLVTETWEDSNLRESLLDTKYMFFVFKRIKNKLIFRGVKLHSFTESDIDKDVYNVWFHTQNIIKNGNIVSYVTEKGIRKTNFSGMNSNPICHVRPHARNAADVDILPIEDKTTGLSEYTKHSFWINSRYIAKIVKDV